MKKHKTRGAQLEGGPQDEGHQELRQFIYNLARRRIARGFWAFHSIAGEEAMRSIRTEEACSRVSLSFFLQHCPTLLEVSL